MDKDVNLIAPPSEYSICGGHEALKVKISSPLARGKGASPSNA